MKSTAGVVQANGVSSFSPFPVHILPHFFHPVCLALVEPCSSREHKFNNDSLPALRTSPPLSARCPRFARNLNSANKASPAPPPLPPRLRPRPASPKSGEGKTWLFFPRTWRRRRRTFWPRGPPRQFPPATRVRDSPTALFYVLFPAGI